MAEKQQSATEKMASTHHGLRKVTETEFQAKETQDQVLRDADHGIQTAIVGEDGAVRTVVGLNGTRYLPDPYPDPLDDVLRVALDTARTERK